jgi:hypothetical protein
MATTRAVSFRHLAFLIACIWFGMVLVVLLRQVSSSSASSETKDGTTLPRT